MILKQINCHWRMKMKERSSHDELIDPLISNLIELTGGNPDSYEGELVSQIIETALKLLKEKRDLGQLKVITRAIKEMRYAYSVFHQYKSGPCISVFGSARTPETHPDYITAVHFSMLMAKSGWMCITGAANGIMKASMEGPKKEQSFGLSILLPFETGANTVIEGDPKLIFFRYFFTRKLMFMSHSNAMAAFPGGFGTLDELFEILTLLQTGKSNIIPVVLVEGPNGKYWSEWQEYVTDHLLKNKWISPEDLNFYYIAPDAEAACRHILKFYSRYHSSRYVGDLLVIRTLTPLTKEQIEVLNRKYGSIIVKGKIEACGAFPEESDHLELPRLAFHHTRNHFAILRLLIDEINNFS